MAAVVLAAKITGHGTRTDPLGHGPSSPACTFLFDAGDVIEYSIRVSIVSPPLPYQPIIVKRRFSEFRELHVGLKEDGIPEPKKMPSRKAGFFKIDKTDDKFIQSRIQSLQEYLDGLLSEPIAHERLIDWQEPLAKFLALAWLFDPSQDPNNANNDAGGGGGTRASEGPTSMLSSSSMVVPPPPPSLNTLRQAAALRLGAQMRGYAGRAAAWKLKLVRPRPLYVNVSHISGYAKVGGGSSLGSLASFSSYCPYVVVSAHDARSGRQLCSGRSLTHASTTTSNWTWDEEWILLPEVLPDAVLVFTVLDQCSIGRDNFLGQTSVALTYAMSKRPPLQVNKSKHASGSKDAIAPFTMKSTATAAAAASSGSGNGFSRSRVPSAPAASSTTSSLGPARTSSTASPVSPNSWMSRMAAMRQPKSNASSSSSRLSVSRTSIDGSNHRSNGLRGSGHGSGKDRNAGDEGNMQFTLKLGKEQAKDVALNGRLPRLPPSISTPTTAYEAAAASDAGAAADGATNATAAAAAGAASAAAGSADEAEPLVPTSFDKTRAFEFGELQAVARWSPLHLCRAGPCYRLTESSMVAKPKWVLVYAVLTRDELVVYEKEGDAKPQRRMPVIAVSKVSATSCQVVAPLVEPPVGIEPWESVVTVAFEDGHPPVHGAATINASLPAAATAINGSSTCPNPWHLLCPDGAKGQVAWRKAINAAIFYQHTAADTSVGPGITEASSTGYDLSFLQPTRTRLPSLIPSERGDSEGRGSSASKNPSIVSPERDESEGRSSSASKDDLVLTPPRNNEASKGRSNSAEVSNATVRRALLDLDDYSMRDSAVFGMTPDPSHLSGYDDL